MKKILKFFKIALLGIVAVLFLAMMFAPDNPDNGDSGENSAVIEDETYTDDVVVEENAPKPSPKDEEIHQQVLVKDTEEKPLPPAPEIPQDSSFEVHFIDVGQADAALIMCDGHYMLIDGGNVDDSSKLYSYLKKRDITLLDYVVGTHAHEDHIGGLAGALNFVSVETVFCSTTTYTTDAFNDFAKTAQKHGAAIAIPSVGTNFPLGSASCRVLAVNTEGDGNNSSIVLRIVYGDTSFLFAGDAEREVEEAILSRGENLNSTVLKVGHHGASDSTSYVWLREVMPEYAVISVGADNSYGHPTEEVLSRLRDAEVETYRTDMQGDIICESDGKTVTVRVARNSDADVFGGIGGNSTQSPPITSEEQGAAGSVAQYVLNNNTYKFHHPDCSSVNKMSEKNKENYYGSRNELITKGFSPCGNCHP